MNCPCLHFLFFLLLVILVKAQQERDRTDNSQYLLVKINSNKHEFHNKLGVQSSPFHNNQISTSKDLEKMAPHKNKGGLRMGKEKNTGYTKVAVALGVPKEGPPTKTLDSIEVIDLSSSSTRCKNLKKFPYTNRCAAGGLGFDDIPIICGGYSNRGSCYSYRNGSWKQDASLKQERKDIAMIRSPFPSDGSILFVAGGSESDRPISSTEILTKDGWEFSTPLPVETKWHCLVRINSSSAIVIGGLSGKDYLTTDRTFILNGETKVWTEGPRLKNARSRHSCAMIKKDSQSHDKSVIVAGGYDHITSDQYTFDYWVPGEYIFPTEVLDVESLEWKTGPQLPIYSPTEFLVEEHSGGVVLIGAPSNLYKLAHAGSDATWEEMDQMLQTPRYAHTVFLIPDELANCN